MVLSRFIHTYAATSFLLNMTQDKTVKMKKYTIRTTIEKVIVIPSTMGVPFKYCRRFVLANNRYLTHSYLLNNWTICGPVNMRNKEIPIASELLLNTVEIINANVTIMIKSTL